LKSRPGERSSAITLSKTPNRADKLLKHIATLGLIGYLPVAPGTWASLAGAAAIYVLRPPQAAYLFSIACVCALGVIAAGAAERLIGEKDSGHIVVDELAGIMISLFALPLSFGYVVSGFILFRIFDILKPFPIRRLDQGVGGGLGIMADDLLAGIYANVLLQLWKLNS
jgi:phosphatidylglycerophosphatase A